MNTKSKPLPARQRLLTEGTKLFSENGFSGTSVREICMRADTGINMVHHYFGNKQGLFEEILAGYSDSVWKVPIRIIMDPPKNRENLIVRFELFIQETLQALIDNRHLFEMVYRERPVLPTLAIYGNKLVEYLNAGKKLKIIRPEIDPEMLTGLILDRLGNQVLYASWMEKSYGYSILSDLKYRKRWLDANTDLILHGLLVSQ